MPAHARPALSPPAKAAPARADDQGLRYRLMVASRSAAAILGGYLLANLFVLAFRRLVPIEPRDASQLALMLSFIVFAIAAIWAFAARDAWRAWAGILLPAAIFALIWWLMPETTIAGARP
ncbi:DUF3649 domain-containing protein [Xinfangfangia sp. D13-10-4-6]|uniref:DUF3649 domain-containing protein n=1 Tax=Pseudogemmobacter hezensis TaxID=2737662 RepID=UPI00155431E4|nr:DUF3649 domain-containing protein [Pseudogemmobacter hezensis]NPD16987.1 DUF3649 domain-containing protein [Pseudogemmobacter hezensis]